jgi:hypothetical protein
MLFCYDTNERQSHFDQRYFIGYRTRHNATSRYTGPKLSLTDSSAAGLKNPVELVSEIVGDHNVLFQVADVRDSTSLNAWIQDTV